MENIIRAILADNIDTEELHCVLEYLIADRLDYSEIAENILDNIDFDALCLEVVSDLLF